MADNADTTYDLVILGGGSGGYACALRAAELGLSVALIEKDKVGGTCLHYGCIPTKALLHAAELADGARESAKFGVKTSFEGIDVPAVHAYKDGVVNRLYKGLQGLVKANKITFIEGEGRLVAVSAKSATSVFGIGDRVFHQKFGPGAVTAVEGNKLTVAFDHAGEKRVIDTFVEPA